MAKCKGKRDGTFRVEHIHYWIFLERGHMSCRLWYRCYYLVTVITTFSVKLYGCDVASVKWQCNTRVTWPIDIVYLIVRHTNVTFQQKNKNKNKTAASSFSTRTVHFVRIFCIYVRCMYYISFPSLDRYIVTCHDPHAESFRHVHTGQVRQVVLWTMLSCSTQITS